MVTVGSAAPPFHCSAVVAGRVVRLRWEQQHPHCTLALLFDPLDSTNSPCDYLRAVGEAFPRLDRLQIRVAVVCRRDLYDLLDWANRLPEEGGPGALALPLIADVDGRIASLYGLEAERVPLWGQFIIDPPGVIRSVTVSAFPFSGGADELLRNLRASALPANKGPWN
jgi:alkyl hydroperoxide reductase subunit AhpC